MAAGIRSVLLVPACYNLDCSLPISRYHHMVIKRRMSGWDWMDVLDKFSVSDLKNKRVFSQYVFLLLQIVAFSVLEFTDNLFKSNNLNLSAQEPVSERLGPVPADLQAWAKRASVVTTVSRKREATRCDFTLFWNTKMR